MKAQIAEARLQGDIETRALRLSSRESTVEPSASPSPRPRRPRPRYTQPLLQLPPPAFREQLTDAVLNFLSGSRFPLSRARASRVPEILTV